MWYEKVITIYLTSGLLRHQCSTTRKNENTLKDKIEKKEDCKVERLIGYFPVLSSGRSDVIIILDWVSTIV